MIKDTDLVSVSIAFSHYCDKCLTTQLMEGRVCFGFRFQGFSPSWPGKDSCRDRRQCLIASTARKQKEMDSSAQLTFFCLFCLGPQNIDSYCPYLGWFYPFQYRIQKIPLRHTQKFISMVSFNPIKLTVEKQHHIRQSIQSQAVPRSQIAKACNKDKTLVSPSTTGPPKSDTIACGHLEPQSSEEEQEVHTPA